MDCTNIWGLKFPLSLKLCKLPTVDFWLLKSLSNCPNFLKLNSFRLGTCTISILNPSWFSTHYLEIPSVNDHVTFVPSLLDQAYFLPVFKKLKATSKKNSSQLFAENSMSWRQLMKLRKKTQGIFKRTIKKSSLLSWVLVKICIILQANNNSSIIPLYNKSGPLEP